VDIRTSRLHHTMTEHGGLLDIRYSIAIEHTAASESRVHVRGAGKALTPPMIPTRPTKEGTAMIHMIQNAKDQAAALTLAAYRAAEAHGGVRLRQPHRPHAHGQRPRRRAGRRAGPSVLQRAGYDVWREFYVNDAGNQIEKFAQSIQARYQQLIRGEDAVAFPEDGYHGDDIRELAQEFRAEYGDGWLDKPRRGVRRRPGAFGLDRNMAQDEDRSGALRHQYDQWFFESELHESGYVADTGGQADQLGYHL
jgi:hypothetical protein